MRAVQTAQQIETGTDYHHHHHAHTHTHRASNRPEDKTAHEIYGCNQIKFWAAVELICSTQTTVISTVVLNMRVQDLRDQMFRLTFRRLIKKKKNRHEKLRVPGFCSRFIKALLKLNYYKQTGEMGFAKTEEKRGNFRWHTAGHFRLQC